MAKSMQSKFTINPNLQTQIDREAFEEKLSCSKRWTIQTL